MINPVPLGDNYFVLRGFPADIKIAAHNPNLVNIIFHKDTTKKYEPVEDLITVSCWLNSSGSKTSLGEIALQCKNRFIVVECKKETNTKNGRTYTNYTVKNITVIPLNVYENEYTTKKLEESIFEFTDEELNNLPF